MRKRGASNPIKYARKDVGLVEPDGAQGGRRSPGKEGMMLSARGSNDCDQPVRYPRRYPDFIQCLNKIR